MIRVGALILVLALAAPTAAIAQQSIAIRGRVVAAENEAALPQTRIVVTVDGAETESVFADERGRFIVAAPHASAFIVSASKAGYGAAQISTTPERASRLTEEIVFALTRASAIAGRVIDASGDPAVDTRVVAERLDFASGGAPSAPLRFQADSDDLGEYRIGGLPPGRYSVAPLALLSDPASLSVVALRPGDEAGSINFVVPSSPQARAAPAPPRPEGRGIIGGRVLGPSGHPLADATVTILGDGGPFKRSSGTDAAGRFVFAGLSAGVFSVQASKSGFAAIQKEQRGMLSARRIEIRAGETAPPLELTLWRGAAISGRVVDERGEPLEGVTIRALWLRPSPGGKVALSAVLPDRWTNDLGRFRLFGLIPGSYLVTASTSEKGSAVNPRAGDYLPVYHPGTTQVSAAVAVRVDFGLDAEGIDLVFIKSRGARVSGGITTAAGGPLNGAVALVERRRAEGVMPERRQTVVDSDGRFVLTGVPPGDYLLEAIVMSTADPTKPEYAAQVLLVADTDPDPVSITTSPGTTLMGHVTIDGRVAQAVSPFLLRPLPVQADYGPLLGGGTSVPLTSDGPFRMTLLNGPTRFGLVGAPKDWFVKSIVIGGVDVTDSPFDFPSKGEVLTGAEFVISNSGASVAGYVTNADAARVNDYAVIVFPTDRAQWFIESRFVKSAGPAPNGSFEINGLPPGDYWVAAIDGAQVLEDRPASEILERVSSSAHRVTLAERQHYVTVLRRDRP